MLESTFFEKNGTSSCVTIDASGTGLVQPESGHVVAKNYKGGASRIQRIETLEDDFEIWQHDSIAHCNIGGWLPTALSILKLVEPWQERMKVCYSSWLKVARIQ